MNKLFAFVLMPFDRMFDDVYRLGIKAAAEELDILAERVDEQIFHEEGILSRILSQIEAADIIIADMTGKNPNVFYEVGYAHAKGKICVLLTQKSDDIPFDLKHHRHIVYNSSILNLKNLLSEDLKSIKEKNKHRKNSLTVDVKEDKFGDLEILPYAAKGSLDIKFDIHASQNSASEIDAMYFYTSDKWTFQQDKINCPYTVSDIPDFSRRHLVKLPIRKLSKGGWAQASIRGSCVLQWAKKDELKSEYKLSGRVAVRVLTSDRNFDYYTAIESTFSEFPF